MANTTADQALSDKIDEALAVFGSRVSVNVTDTAIIFNNNQKDAPGANPIVHTFTLKTTSEALLKAFAAALVAQGRP